MRGIASLLAVACVASACWTEREARPQTPYPVSKPIVREPFPLRSEWRGVYRCSQGETGVTLVLDADRSGALRAVFEFGPTAENPHLPSGAYKLLGTIQAGPEGTFDIALEPAEWINAPDGYIMVPVQARSSRRWQRMVGRMMNPSCGTLDVRRVDDPRR